MFKCNRVLTDIENTLPRPLVGVDQSSHSSEWDTKSLWKSSLLLQFQLSTAAFYPSHHPPNPLPQTHPTQRLKKNQAIAPLTSPHLNSPAHPAFPPHQPLSPQAAQSPSPPPPSQPCSALLPTVLPPRRCSRPNTGPSSVYRAAHGTLQPRWLHGLGEERDRRQSTVLFEDPRLGFRRPETHTKGLRHARLVVDSGARSASSGQSSSAGAAFSDRQILIGLGVFRLGRLDWAHPCSSKRRARAEQWVSARVFVVLLWSCWSFQVGSCLSKFLRSSRALASIGPSLLVASL